MKIGSFTGGTSLRSINIFNDISRYPTGKHEITYMCNNIRQTWSMRNGTIHKWCPFCRLLRHACCHVCSARWNGRCVDRGTTVVYSYTPIKPHRVSQANWFPFHTLFTSRKKYRIWNKNYSACCNLTNYEESSRSSLILVASYDMP